MDIAGTSGMVSATVESSWIADDMASSYRSWSSRGIAASGYDQEGIQESQANDAIALDRVSSSNDSWHSDSKSPGQELSSDGRSGLSHDSMTHGDHKRDVNVG
jgi:hypothetical protein